VNLNPIYPMELSATYSPEDNKLRLYSTSRLDKETYSRLKEAGFSWAPKQELFVAPAWTPHREDILLELCGTIEDEDKSLVKRAEERAERFGDYSDNRAKDAEEARKKVASIAENIPFGQPILVGHHSERRARRDAERIDSGMRSAVQNWESSKYWEERARGVLQTAKHKERPDVRSRRIKKLEAELRKMERNKEEAERFIKAWSIDKLTMPLAAAIASRDHGYFLNPAERTDGKSWPVTLWDVTQGRYEPQPELKDIAARAIQNLEKTVTWADRWITHLTNRLEYERTLLKEQGGIVADQVRPEIGGACKCWASPRGGWSIIQKVNKVSVTVLDNWGNGGADFPRNMPFDKLTAIMSKAEVDAARQSGQLIGESSRGFFLGPKTGESQAPDHGVKL
jgi:hypothetical protein